MSKGVYKIQRRAESVAGTVLGLMSLAGLSLPLPVLAQTIEGSATGFYSNADRMVSYRHQEHSWQTSDGYLHLTANGGNPAVTPGGNGVQLFTSANNGQTWTLDLTLPNTGTFSVPDGQLVPHMNASGVVTNDDLYLVYSDNTYSLNTNGIYEGGSILFTDLHYDEGTHSWTLVNTNKVFDTTASTLAGLNPALAIDAMGRIWCAYVAETEVRTVGIPYQAPPYPSSVIRMAVGTTASPASTSAPAWQDTGLSFGQTDNTTPTVERSARPVVLSDGMGMVYAVHQNIYWTRRGNSTFWPLTSKWSAPKLIFSSKSTDSNPYESHFSIITDDQQNMHMVLGDNGLLRYASFADSTQSWGPVQDLTAQLPTAPNGKVQGWQIAYPKLTMIANASLTTPVMAITFNAGSDVFVIQSNDRGGSWVNIGSPIDIRHDNLNTSTSDFTHPRPELPDYLSTLTVPVLQQYTDGTTTAATTISGELANNQPLDSSIFSNQTVNRLMFVCINLNLAPPSQCSSN